MILLEDISVVHGRGAGGGALHSALAEPFDLSRHDLFVPAAWNRRRHGGYFRREVLSDADMALYRAKTGGQERHLHVRSPDARDGGGVLDGDRLHRAIERGEFELDYQPIVSGDGRLAALEALVRWRRRQGVVMPGAFISIAESGLRAAREAGAAQRLPAAAPLAARDPVPGRHGRGREHLPPAVRVAGGGGRRGRHPRRDRPAAAEPAAGGHGTAASRTPPRPSTWWRGCGPWASSSAWTTWDRLASLSQLPRNPIDELNIDRTFVGEMQPRRHQPHDTSTPSSGSPTR